MEEDYPDLTVNPSKHLQLRMAWEAISFGHFLKIPKIISGSVHLNVLPDMMDYHSGIMLKNRYLFSGLISIFMKM